MISSVARFQFVRGPDLKACCLVPMSKNRILDLFNEAMGLKFMQVKNGRCLKLNASLRFWKKDKKCKETQR